jgi:hypothetical protein
MNNPDESSAAADLGKALMPVAAAAGLPIAAKTESVPEIDVRLIPLRMARDLGAFLHDKGLFTLPSGAVVTVKADGTFEPMTTNRFRTWAAHHVSFVEYGKEKPRSTSLTRDAAGVLLEADVFRAQLPLIQKVRSVRLPAFTSDGGVRLLPAGYDAESRVWTLNELDYDLEMTPADAVRALDELLTGYPWSDGTWKTSRYAACHLSALLTLYCEHMLTGALVPAFLWNANKKGSGKTMLAKMPLLAVHGRADQTDWTTKPEAMTDLLDAAVLSGNPFLLFDDIEADELRSHALNAFVTSLRRSGRIKGVSRTFSVENTTRIFCTGNTKALDGELGRRTIVIDLFSALDPAKRKHALTIDEPYILSRRADILAACWCLVREWFKAGAPANETRRGSFERWSQIIGGIVTLQGMADPVPLSEAARDEKAAAMEAAIVALADDVAEDGKGNVTVDDIRNKLSDHGTLDAVVPWAKNEKGERVKLGLLLIKWKGSEMLDSAGRCFVFGRREQSDRTHYEIRYQEK